MDLTSIYNKYKIFEPYIKLIMYISYNEKGYPRIIDVMEFYMTPEDHKIFSENIVLLHKKMLELDRIILEINRKNIENYNLFLRSFFVFR